MAHQSKTVRTATLLLALALVTTSLSAPAVAATPPNSGPVWGTPGIDFVEGEVLVQYDSASRARSAVAESNRQSTAMGTGRSAAAVGKSARIKLSSETSVGEAIRSMKSQAGVQYVQPNYIYTADDLELIALSPNDSLFSGGYLWGLHNDGTTFPSYNVPATAGVDIGAEAAWNVTTGSRDVVVAVIDTGVDYTHPDLAANMWSNPDEIPGNGIDDDNSGALVDFDGDSIADPLPLGVDDVHGADLFEMDGDPMDAHAHGTHVAGTIGAVGNNEIGTSGVAWNVQLMAVRFMGADGRGTTFDGMLSVLYAAQQGADVINCSWGDPVNSETGQTQTDQLLRQALADSGLLVVCAAGNGGLDGVGDNNDSTPFLPASHDLANIVSVGAHTPDDKLATFSNYGATSVDILAPGTYIASTVPTWTRDGAGQQVLYAFLQGTSMAAPHVTGVAALLLGEDSSLTPTELKDIILNSALVPEGNPYVGRCVSEGRLNAARALNVYQSERGNLAGTVRSAVDGQAIEGARVSVVGSLVATATAPDGTFILENIPEGSRTLNIEANEYEPLSATVSVTAWTTSYPFGSEGARLREFTAVSASAPAFTYSAATTLSGRVTGLGNAAAGSGGTVRLTASRDGGKTWVAVGDAAVAADGSWSRYYNPAAAYETIHQVRATYLGSPQYTSSAAVTPVTPLAYLSTPSLSVSSPRARAKFTVRGYIGPRFGAGIVPARAYFYKRQPSGAYALVKSIGLRTSTYSSARTILTGSTYLPSRGTYRVRFMYGGTVRTSSGTLLGKTYGPWRYITVR